MQAYAIFAGGGVKGVAFAGCLVECEQRKIEFLGYGGTSAGSLVALLASIGYTPQQIQHLMLDEVDYRDFLGDRGDLLGQLYNIRQEISSARYSLLAWGQIIWGLCRSHPRFEPLKIIRSNLGLYPGHHMAELIKALIVRRDGYGDLAGRSDITFGDLRERGAKPLKIVASDLKRRKARIFSAADGAEASVITALRASSCYPFIFQPVQYGDDHYLVDGGLSSNLPVFLFNRERATNRKPVIAFDLVIPEGPARPAYSISEYCEELLDTALEAGNTLIRSSTEAVHHIEIVLPKPVKALDFGLTHEEKFLLYQTGRTATADFFNRQLPHAGSEQSKVERIQAAAGEPALIEASLAALAKEIETLTKAIAPRCSVLLPSGDDMQMVVYHYGKDEDSDLGWEIPLNAGPSGQAREAREPFVISLDEVRAHPEKFKLQAWQARRIPSIRKTVYCRPIYEFVSNIRNSVQERAIIGTLWIDTESGLAESDWIQKNRLNPALEGVSAVWSDIIAKLID